MSEELTTIVAAILLAGGEQHCSEIAKDDISDAVSVAIMIQRIAKTALDAEKGR